MIKALLLGPLLGVINFAVFAVESAPEWVTYLLNGGPFAIVLLLIIMDKITTTGERDRLRKENEDLRVEIKSLNLNIQKEIMPPLIQLNILMKEVVIELARKENTSLYRGRSNEPL